jgi:hypothetical protein
MTRLNTYVQTERPLAFHSPFFVLWFSAGEKLTLGSTKRTHLLYPIARFLDQHNYTNSAIRIKLFTTTALEDAIYNFTRPVKTLRVELEKPTKQARWHQRSPAMAAGLTDHIWTVKELLHFVPTPPAINT